MRELERECSSDPPACTRLAIVGRGRLGNALAAALSDSRYELLGPLGRGVDGAGADVVLLCVPDGEIADCRRADLPRPARRPLLRRHRTRGARTARGVLVASADDRDRTGRGVRRRRRRDRRSTPRALAVAASSRARSGCEPSKSPSRPRRVSRGRLDRLQLPDHARGRGRAARGRRRASTASCWCRSSARPSRTGPRSGPSGR